MQIWKIQPTYKDYVWGGTKLKERYHANTDKEIVGEVWALSCHPDGPNTILTGEHQGEKLQDVLENKALWGTNAQSFDRFPILTKLLDAKQHLSIQVHPDDELGWELEKEYGKTEAWYVLEAEEGAFLYYGLNRDMTKDEFRASIENHTICDYLNKVPVKKGDVLFVGAGTIHALCAGAVIIEVQQNSNTTYRIYDHGRVGADGKPRELHIEKSLLASNLHQINPVTTPAGEPVEKDGAVVTLIAKCKYFIEELYQVKDKAKISLGEDSFRHIIAVCGDAKLLADGEEYVIKQGESYFLPAQKGELIVEGNVELMVSHV